MSYTIIYTTDEKGNARELAEIHNAWSGAFHIWECLAYRYVPESRDDPYWNVLFHTEPVFALFKDRPRVLRTERIVLGTTFDKVMVKRADIMAVYFAMGEFVSRPGWNSENIQRQMAALHSVKDDPKVFAVFWNQTSVTDAWMVYDPGTEDSRLYDITRDTGHWFLFDELDK